MRGNLSAVVLILIGCIALAHNLGYLNINLAHLIRTWWPLLLIALGLGFFFTPGSGQRK